LEGISVVDVSGLSLKRKFAEKLLTKKDVADEEDGDCNIILIASQIQVFHHTFDLGIS
jgi:hypothetical protein